MDGTNALPPEIPLDVLKDVIKAIVHREDPELLTFNVLLRKLALELLPGEPDDVLLPFKRGIRTVYKEIISRLQHERPAAEDQPSPQRQRSDDAGAHVAADADADATGGEQAFDEQALRTKVLYSDSDPDWDAIAAEFNTGAAGFTAWLGQQMQLLTDARTKFIQALRQVERAGSYAAVLGIDSETGDIDTRAAAQRRAHRKLAVLLHPDKHGGAPPDFQARIEAVMKRLNDAKDTDAAELDEPFEDVPQDEQGRQTNQQAAAQQAAEERRAAAREKAEAASRAASEFQQRLRAVVKAPLRATQGMKPWARGCGGGPINIEFVPIDASKVPEYGSMYRTVDGRLIEPEPMNNNVLVVEAGCSSQKTRTLLRWIRNMIDETVAVIFITTRKTHADDTAAVLDDFDLFDEFGFKNYLDATKEQQGKREFLEKAPRLIVSLQSLHLVELAQFQGGIVVMDEVRSAASIPGGKTLPKPILNVQVALKELFSICQYRVVMDADISADGAVEALLRIVAPSYDLLHVQLTQAALERTMAIAFTGPKGSTGKAVHEQWLKLWLLRARQTHVPLAQAHRDNAARFILRFLQRKANQLQHREATAVEKRAHLLTKMRQVHLRLRSQRTVGRVLICCATPTLARRAAKLCDKLDVRYHFYDGGSSDKEKRLHFSNTTEHWWQADAVIATTALCVAVNVQIHFACVFIFAQTHAEAGKLRELLQAAVRVGRDKDDPLEDVRIFTLIPGEPPSMPDILEKYGGQLPTQEKRFQEKLKDMKRLDNEVMRVERESNAKGRELFGVVGDAAGDDSMLPSTERVGGPLLELMAWNALEIDENEGSRALLKLAELCVLPTRAWPIVLLQEMSEEEAAELAELEQEIKDLAIDDRHATYTEDQRIGKMSPVEKYEWVCGQVREKAETEIEAREEATGAALDEAAKADALAYEQEAFFTYEEARTRGLTQARRDGDNRENARELVFNALEHLYEFPNSKVFSVLNTKGAALLRRAYMITVPLDEQQKVHEYLRLNGKTAHPMVETSKHFTYIELEKLSQVLKLPSIDSLLYETTFTEADEWVQVFNRRKRGDESHKTADEAMEAEVLRIAKLLKAKVTKQMGLQKIISRVLTDVCAMDPGIPHIDKVPCGAPTGDGRAQQLITWKVDELLPDTVSRLRLVLFTPEHNIEHVRASEWRQRFDQLYNQASEAQRWDGGGEPMDEDEQLDADMRDAAPASFAQPDLNAWAAPFQRRFDPWSKVEHYQDAPLQLWLSDLEHDEGWRRDGARRVYNRLADVRSHTPDSAEVGELEATYKKLKRCEGFHSITYKLANLPLDAAGDRRVQTIDYEQKGVGGRRYAKGESIHVGGGDRKPRSTTGQGMYSDLRAVVFGATAYDVDCENGDFRLVLSLAEQLGLQANVCQVKHYVTYRDAWLQEIMEHHSVDKGTAKRLPNVVANGGGYRTWLRDNGMDVDAQKFEPVLKLQKELKELRAVLFQHPRFKPMIDTERARLVAAKQKTEHGIDASLMSRIMQTCENEVLGIIDRVCFDMGWDTLALVFDGLVVEPGTACTTVLRTDVLKAAEERCAQDGWHIKLAVKPLHGMHQTLGDPPPTVTEAREALRRFEARVG